jgi:hypothetical protein
MEHLLRVLILPHLLNDVISCRDVLALKSYRLVCKKWKDWVDNYMEQNTTDVEISLGVIMDKKSFYYKPQIVWLKNSPTAEFCDKFYVISHTSSHDVDNLIYAPNNTIVWLITDCDEFEDESRLIVKKGGLVLRETL